MSSKLVAGAAAAVGLVLSSAASAQMGVQTFSNFRWYEASPAACIEGAHTAINSAISGFSLGGLTGGEDTWFVNAVAGDLNMWVYCIADDNTTALDGAVAKRVLVVVNVNTSRGAIGGQLRDFLTECMDVGCPLTVATGPVAERIDWTATAAVYRGNNNVRYSFICPALGGGFNGAVWGKDIYTDDSSICSAGVHAGAIGFGGGTMTIEILPGQPSYDGLVRNGITTNPWTSFLGSFRVIVGG